MKTKTNERTRRGRASSGELLEAYRTTRDDQIGVMYFLAVEREREASGLNALMAKFTAAREAGLDMNEADKTKLLALLLDDKLRGTMSGRP